MGDRNTQQEELDYLSQVLDEAIEEVQLRKSLYSGKAVNMQSNANGDNEMQGKAGGENLSAKAGGAGGTPPEAQGEVASPEKNKGGAKGSADHGEGGTPPEANDKVAGPGVTKSDETTEEDDVIEKDEGYEIDADTLESFKHYFLAALEDEDFVKAIVGEEGEDLDKGEEAAEVEAAPVDTSEDDPIDEPVQKSENATQNDPTDDSSNELVKSLVDKLDTLGGAFEALNNKVEELYKQPASGRRSLNGVTPILRKSEEGSSGGTPLDKALVANRLMDLFEGGESRLNPQAINYVNVTGDLRGIPADIVEKVTQG